MMRSFCLTRKVVTDFGSFYVHIDLNVLGQPVGGAISTPMKEPESQITNLIHQLSEALDDALGEIAGTT